jgi:hypothetical protein
MHRLAIVTVFVLASAVPSPAQDSQASRDSATRWIVDFESGSDSGFGFKLPHLAIGGTVERPVGKRLEIQAELSYSPDKKYITNDGNSIRMATTLIVWASQKVGISAEVGEDYLWTSQFNENDLAPAFGFVVRDYFEGAPGRLYLSYLVPTGCQWGPTCPIQSKRMQGVQGSWEHRLFPHFRLGFSMGVCRFLNQSNQLEPSVPRTQVWAGDVHLLMRFEFPPGSMEQTY